MDRKEVGRGSEPDSGTIVGVLWSLYCIIWFPKGRGISWLAEQLEASEEGSCSIKWMTSLVFEAWNYFHAALICKKKMFPTWERTHWVLIAKTRLSVAYRDMGNNHFSKQSIQKVCSSLCKFCCICPILTKFGMCLQVVVRIHNINFHLNLSCGIRAVPWGWTDRRREN